MNLRCLLRRRAHPRRTALWRCVSVLVLMLIAGCTGAPPLLREVKVPVYLPCVKAMPVRPLFATRTLAPDASDGEKVLAIARDLPMHLRYEGELEALLLGCLASAG